MLTRCLAVVILGVTVSPLRAQPATPADFPMLPRDLEIELALSAAPPHLREGAAVKSTPLPHVMFYGPRLTDADIGGARGSTVFMNKVGPDGMVIVPVGSAERQAILDGSGPLTTRLEQALGYRPR